MRVPADRITGLGSLWVSSDEVVGVVSLSQLAGVAVVLGRELPCSNVVPDCHALRAAVLRCDMQRQTAEDRMAQAPGTSLCRFFPGTSGRCSGERRPPRNNRVESKRFAALRSQRGLDAWVEPRVAVVATVLKFFEEGVVGRIARLRHALLVPNAAIGPASRAPSSLPRSAASKGLRNSQPGWPGSSPPGGAGQPGGVVAWPQATSRISEERHLICMVSQPPSWQNSQRSFQRSGWSSVLKRFSSLSGSIHSFESFLGQDNFRISAIL